MGVRFLDDGRGIGPDDTADGHEEAGTAIRSAGMKWRVEQPNTDPNVAPDAAIYWPIVLMIPFGPAPYRKMLTVPAQTISLWASAVAVAVAVAPPLTVYEAENDTDSYGQLLADVAQLNSVAPTAAHHGSHLYCVSVSGYVHSLPRRNGRLSKFDGPAWPV